MKKRIILFAACALVISMAACSTGKAEDETSLPTGSTAETNVENTTQAAAPTETEGGFEEIVLADNDDVKIIITNVVEDPVWGYTLQVYLENKTEKTLMFSLDETSVNGFMCDPFWAESIAAGKRSNSRICFSESEFEKNGIEAVEEITFTLRVYDYNDWTAEDVLNETITIDMK